MTKKQTGLQMAIAHVGRQQDFGRALGASPRLIKEWLAADEPVPRATSAVDKAVEKAGSWNKLAVALGVTRQAVGQWLRQGYVPLARAKEIEMQFGIPRNNLVSPKVRSSMGVGGEL